MAHRTSRLYWRMQGGERRAYGDFRDYADVGGRREALKARGEKRATTDKDIAQQLVTDRVKELDAARRGRALHGIADAARLEAFGAEHLIAKKKSGRYSDQWLEASELHLRRAASHFGADRDLLSITVADVQAWIVHLQSLSNGRGATLGGGSIRHHLNSLSNLFRRAQSLQCVQPGYNPVAALLEKPAARRKEAKWLEVHDAALFLEAARTWVAKRRKIAIPFAYPLIATFLLTGGRTSEVLGLEVSDISFDRRTVTFRPNRWRRLKTETSSRPVPLWPQLEEILRPYVFGAENPPRTLLFPSHRQDGEEMLTDCRRLLDGIARRAGWRSGEIRSRMFRHTYTAARLQTLDQGAPVTVYTVAKELGHGSEQMINRVYGHLGQIRHRSAVVEFRVEQHAEVLGERLQHLASISA